MFEELLVSKQHIYWKKTTHAITNFIHEDNLFKVYKDYSPNIPGGCWKWHVLNSQMATQDLVSILNNKSKIIVHHTWKSARDEAIKVL